MTVIDALKKLGYNTIDASFYDKIREWKSWYVGDVKGFHRYTVNNGEQKIDCKRYSLGMGKKLAEDWANLLMNEKVAITLEGEKEQQFVTWVFQKNSFEVKTSEMQELKSAVGTVAYIPRVVGLEADESGAAIPGSADGIVLDCLTAENIYPLTSQNGFISECAFTSEAAADGKKYCYMQIHKKGDGGLYIIENKIFLAENGNLTETDLTQVKGFETVPPVVHTGSAQRQFVIDRLNIANNFDYSVPLGIPVYANALDVLRGVDIAYDSYVNEFVLGKKRIMVKPSATTYLNGQPVFNPEDLTFYVLPEDVADGAVITPIDMKLRTAEHNTGIQDQLNLLSSKCGFGETYYRFNGGSVATATQVISENSTMFRTIKKHEIILHDVLVELCRIIMRLGNTAMNAGLDEDVDITIDFDDSIIEDKQTIFNQTMQMLAAGIIHDWEARAELRNEDTETAKKMLPGMESLTTEKQDEIE